MKNVTINLSLSAVKKAFFAFLHRFHVILFVVIVMGGLAISVFILNGIIIRSGDTTGITSSGNSNFDQATIKRINELQTPDQNSDTLDLSKGRTNPFVE
jgi:hypothetical protein